MSTEAKARILVVDDDARLRSLLERYLAEQGYGVRSAADADAMSKALARELCDLIVLDLMLPGEDGLAICRRLRSDKAASSAAPAIIMLTGRWPLELRREPTELLVPSPT